MPFEIPENWVWTTIEDIAESNIGLTYKPTDICANGVPVYRSNNIQNRRICLKELVRVNTNILEKQYLQEGDLLICARNGSRNLVGKCALIDNLNEPTSFGAFMAVCRSALNPWIFQILNSEYFNTYLDDSNSTAINQVTQKMLLAFQLPIPPAAEQERIISKLKQWYEYIDEIEDRKIELESYIKQTKSKILDLAISGKLVSQDPNDEPAIELLKRINPAFQPCDNSHYENLPFEVPDGWCWAKINDVTEFIKNGAQIKQFKGASGIPITRIETISNSELDMARMGYANITNGAEYKDYYIKDGDILMSHINSRAHIGKCALCNVGENQIIHGMNLLRIRCSKQILPEYMVYYFRSTTFYNLIEPHIKNAVNQASINITNLQKILIPIPPYSEQRRVAFIVDKLFSTIDTITAEL